MSQFLQETSVKADASSISFHGHPRPRLHRIRARLTGLALIVMLAAILGQALLALAAGPLALLLCGSALLTGILTIPLLLQTVLHPAITLRRDGLEIAPMLWQAQFIPWSAIRGIVPHPLVHNDEAVGRHLYGRGYRARQGTVILVNPDGLRLSPLYQLVGGLAGAGNVPAFAISSTTHTEFDSLLAALEAHVTP
jgi:hypothetical protein